MSRPLAKTAIRPVQVPVVQDKDQDRLNRELAAVARELGSNPFLSGVELDVELSTTEKKVSHGLGRTPRGFLVLDREASFVVYRTGESTDTHMFLKASSASLVPATLWVF